MDDMSRTRKVGIWLIPRLAVSILGLYVLAYKSPGLTRALAPGEVQLGWRIIATMQPFVPIFAVAFVVGLSFLWSHSFKGVGTNRLERVSLLCHPEQREGSHTRPGRGPAWTGGVRM